LEVFEIKSAWKRRAARGLPAESGRRWRLSTGCPPAVYSGARRFPQPVRTVVNNCICACWRVGVKVNAPRDARRICRWPGAESLRCVKLGSRADHFATATARNRGPTTHERVSPPYDRTALPQDNRREESAGPATRRHQSVVCELSAVRRSHRHGVAGSADARVAPASRPIGRDTLTMNAARNVWSS
jgi:hypothetical protein